MTREVSPTPIVNNKEINRREENWSTGVKLGIGAAAVSTAIGCVFESAEPVTTVVVVLGLSVAGLSAIVNRFTDKN